MSQESIKPTDPRVMLAGTRTGMASFRTQLALDRTTLARIRTTLTMATFGFGIVAFFGTSAERFPTAESIRMHQAAIRFGIGLILIAIAATVISSEPHWFILHLLRRGEPPALTQWPLSITVAMLFAVLGLAGLWSLLAG
jgi:putative membrane protein